MSIAHRKWFVDVFFVSFIQPLQSILNAEVVPFVYRNVEHDNLPFCKFGNECVSLFDFLLTCVFNCHGRGPSTVKSKLNGTLLKTILIS